MWVPIARISFCMYLVQMIVIFFSTYGSSQIHYFQNSHMLFFILVDIVYSMLLGGLLSLMVEVTDCSSVRYLS
jgi:peptidoglycan/LPS O-acetylase OafA/YrhL